MDYFFQSQKDTLMSHSFKLVSQAVYTYQRACSYLMKNHDEEDRFEKAFAKAMEVAKEYDGTNFEISVSEFLVTAESYAKKSGTL